MKNFICRILVIPLLLLLFSIEAIADNVKIYYSLPADQVGDKVVELYAAYTIWPEWEYSCVMSQVGTYYGDPVYCADIAENHSIYKLDFRLCTIDNSDVDNPKLVVASTTQANTTLSQLSYFDGKMYQGGSWKTQALDNYYTVYYAGTSPLTSASVINGSSNANATVTKTDKTYNGYDIYSVASSVPFTPANITFNDGAQRTFKDGKLYTDDDCLEYAYDGGPYTLTGNFNSWASPGTEFLETDESNKVSASVCLVSGNTYTFKVICDGYLYSSSQSITENSNNITVSKDYASPFSVTPTLTGLYVFTIDKNTKALTVTYPHYELPPVNPLHKPVLQQKRSNEIATYFKNRRALVGNGCMVNKLATVVGVGSWASNLGNLTDENLDNFVSFNNVVGASVGTNPIAGVRDMNHHYEAGTKAGFHVLTSSDSKVLSLDVIKAFAITFYCEGKIVGTVPIATDINVLQLDLISFSAGKASIDIEAVAPEEFDEVLLQPGGGINANVVNAMQVQYAYVGDAYKYTLTNQGTGEPNGIEEYQTDYHRNLTLSATYGGVSTAGLFGQLIDKTLTNGVSGSLLTLGNLVCQVNASVQPGDAEGEDSAPFKKGDNVGVHFTQGSALNLGLGTTMTMQLIGKDGNVLQEEHLNTTVVGLGVAQGGSGDNVITAKQDFYSVKFTIGTVSVNLGAFTVNYFYVTPPPAFDHKCDISATADTDLCDFEDQIQLNHNKDIDVTWSVIEQPSGANVSIDQGTELATGLTVDGTYKFRATAADGCYQTVTITRGELKADPNAQDHVLYNISEDNFMLSDDTHGISGSLISITDLSDPENILNGQFEDFAQYSSGLSLANNLMVVGVKTKDGSVLKGKNNDPIKRVGFVVETTSTGLDLSALQFFQILGFKNGIKKFERPVEESNAVALNLIGSNKVQKMRMSVGVNKDGAHPEEQDIDEIQLWKSGVLNLTLSNMNIYYAFANDTDYDPTSIQDAMGCGLEVISNTSTGATINSDANQNLQVLGVANVSDNISYIIDDDPELETYLTIAKTVDAGGAVYAVRLGRTFTASHQIGVVMDNATYVASVGVGSWLTMATYKDGVATGDANNDWKVLGVNAAGYGDKRVLLMYPTQDYDEVRLTFGSVVGAIDYPKIYGFVVRKDVDHDGIPDCQDSQSCYQELILDEDANRPGSNANGDYRSQGFNHKSRDYNHARMVLHRNITRGANIEENLWVSLTLPVNLTGLQLRNAFGNQTRLAVADGILSNNNNRINFQFIDLDADKDNDGIPDLDNETALEAGKYYIIQVVRPPQINIGERYESSTETTRNGYVDGEVYFVNDVDYDHTHSYTPGTQQDDVINANKAYIRFDGTYEATQFGGDGISTYAFNSGKLYHTTQGSHNMLGFRFWITEGESTVPVQTKRVLDFFVTDEFGEQTSIIPIADGIFADANSAVYSVSGMYVGKVSEVKKPGLYITGGHKFVVK